MVTVINRNRKGEIIPDLTSVVIRHDEHPEIWKAVARMAEEMKMEESKNGRQDA